MKQEELSPELLNQARQLQEQREVEGRFNAALESSKRECAQELETVLAKYGLSLVPVHTLTGNEVQGSVTLAPISGAIFGGIKLERNRLIPSQIES